MAEPGATGTPLEWPSFGELLRHYRTAAGLSQEELGQRAGLSAHAISDLERAGLVAAVRRSGRPSSPMSALHKPRRSLPQPPTPLVGRETELARLGVRLHDTNTRLLILTGAGGSGKTRLALQLANDLLDHFPDGVCLVELASLADGRLVPQAVASALGIESRPGPPLVDVLVGALQQRTLLLVLDNCEHLVDACASLSERLLGECPRLHILATSREPCVSRARYSGAFRRSACPMSPHYRPPVT
jgi:hypothetical protein